MFFGDISLLNYVIFTHWLQEMLYGHVVYKRVLAMDEIATYGCKNSRFTVNWGKIVSHSDRWFFTDFFINKVYDIMIPYSYRAIFQLFFGVLENFG